MGSKRENEGLSGPYWAEFRRLHRRLCRDIAPVDDRREALDGIYTLLLEAQAQKKPPQSVYGGSFSDFYEALLEALPGAYSREGRRERWAWKIGLGALAGLLVLGLCVGLVVWYSGWLGIHTRGIDYLAENTRYTLARKPVEGVFSLEVDLNDLADSRGKTIYDDGQCVIRLAALRQDGQGKYTAFFQAEGDFSQKEGRLVSAVEELRTPTGQRGICLAGSLQVQVGNTVYTAGCTLLSEGEEGNGFAFSLFGGQNGPTAAQMIDEAGGRITLQLQGLVEMEWRRSE